MTDAPVPLAEQPTPEDEKRLACYRNFMEIDHGVTAPDVAFFLRLLDQAHAERDAYAERWRSVTKECDKALQQRERAMAVAKAARKVPRPHGEHVAEWNALWAALRDLAALDDAASAAGDEG